MVAWSIPEDKDTGFVNPGNYSNPDIICHKGATPAQEYVTVAAGETVELQWTKWPESHHGPVMDYLANCNGDCTTVEKTQLQFNKIDEQGLESWTSQPGSWASDKLIAANNSWTVTVPESIAPGNYVLRHEIIALHSANNPDGAQNYPQCINLKVTGSGTDKLASGTPGTALYTPKDAGILVNIYVKLSSYIIPGPGLYEGGLHGTAPTTTAAPSGATSSSYGYGAVPTSGASSTAVIALTTVGPIPTGLYSNSTSTSPGKLAQGHKKPCKPAGSDKAHNGPGVGDQPTSTATSATTTSPTTAETDSGSTAAPSTSVAGVLESRPPSSVVAAPIGSVTASPSSTPGSAKGALPQEPKNKLPEGMTVKELFAWLHIIVSELEAKTGGKVRRHARDFLDL